MKELWLTHGILHSYEPARSSRAPQAQPIEGQDMVRCAELRNDWGRDIRGPGKLTSAKNAPVLTNTRRIGYRTTSKRSPHSGRSSRLQQYLSFPATHRRTSPNLSPMHLYQNKHHIYDLSFMSRNWPTLYAPTSLSAFILYTRHHIPRRRATAEFPPTSPFYLAGGSKGKGEHACFLGGIDLRRGRKGIHTIFGEDNANG